MSWRVIIYTVSKWQVGFFFSFLRRRSSRGCLQLCDKELCLSLSLSSSSSVIGRIAHSRSETQVSTCFNTISQRVVRNNPSVSLIDFPSTEAAGSPLIPFSSPLSARQGCETNHDEDLQHYPQTMMQLLKRSPGGAFRKLSDSPGGLLTWSSSPNHVKRITWTAHSGWRIILT